MNRQRLRAPQQDGVIFAEPPLAEVKSLIAENAERLGSLAYDVQGRSLGSLRRQARQEVTDEARRFLARCLGPGEVATHLPPADFGPGHTPLLIATGHQPEMFHPGVWAKNFAGYALAREWGAIALNLIVDEDIAKATSIRVPSGTPREPSLRRIEFDVWHGELPYEDLRVSDPALFASFGDRVRQAMSGYPFEPLIGEYWPLVLEMGQCTDLIGERLAMARHLLEVRWGTRNLELPLSRMCQTEGFYWFASHLLAQLPRFRTIYNRALADYRAANGIRSKNHPVPALAEEHGWMDAPFWVWRAGSPRRRPLQARSEGRQIALRDPQGEIARLPLAAEGEACCAVEVLGALPGRGIKLRTRALTTTMFARLVLSDLFIHGIGGAKYDGLADAIIRDFFGIEPPGFFTLSATCQIPAPKFPATPHQYSRTAHDLRDLWYNPDRHLPPSADQDARVHRWVEEKHHAIAWEPRTFEERRRRHATIQAMNERLRPYVRQQETQAKQALEQGAYQLRANAILKNREYAFPLYPADRLRKLFGQLAETV